MKYIYLFSVLILNIYGQSFAQNINISDSLTQVNNQEITGPIFIKTEVSASFPGGDSAWQSYLGQNLNPAIGIKNGAPAGSYQVIIRFVVSKNGATRNIESETGFGYGMETEVIRVIRNSPIWSPAVQNGYKVNSYRRQPVTFVVEEKISKPK